MDIRDFQQRYQLQNREMAKLCGCSVPTIQKWRSGEVPVSGAARQLLRVLEMNAQNDPLALRELEQKLEGAELNQEKQAPSANPRSLESSMNQVVDRLELMLESRRKERELIESKERYRSMVEAQEEPVCRWVPDTTLTYANRAYARLFGENEKEITGKKWIEFVPWERRGHVMTLVSDIVRRGEPESYQHEILDGEGQQRLFKWKDIPIHNERGEVTELHSFGRDITEEEATRRRLRETEEQLGVLCSMCNLSIALMNEEGVIRQRNHQFKNEIGSEETVTELADLCQRFPRRKFVNLMRKLGPGDQLAYRLPGAVHIFHLRIGFVGEYGGERRFLIKVERGVELTRQSPTMRVRFLQEAGVEEGEAPLLVPVQEQERLQALMSDLGLEATADRVYVFTFDDRAGYFDNVMEWCAKGVEAQLPHLRRIPQPEYPWWIERLRSGQWIQVEDVSKMPHTAHRERTVLEAQDIKAVLVAPLLAEDKVVGFVGVDVNHTTRIWHAQDTQLLAQLKEAFEAALAPVLQQRETAS